MSNSLKFILFASSFSHILHADTIGTYYGQTLVRPFGYIAPRPPTGANVIDLSDIKIQFNARQVCGYTDWSTAVIGFPKQILSGKYWKSIGDQIAKQAVNSVLAISGALPSMLACSASPNFCAVLNRAEALAQANLKFTFDSCQMLEGLSDTTKSHFGPLAGCVQKHVNDGINQSQALDLCSVGNRDPESVSSKQKIHEAQKNVPDPYKSEKLTERLCRERQSARYRSSSHAYTISEYSCNWVKSFFPGITVEAGAKFRHGGTFSNSPAEENYDDTLKKSSIFLVKALDTMHALRYGKAPYSSQGPRPRHLVIGHSDVKKLFGQRSDGKIENVCYPEDGERCTSDISKLPPVYKFSAGKSIPALIISPALLYELVDVIHKDSSPSEEYKKETSRIALSLEPLSQAIAYTTTQDIIKDSIVRLRRTCADPDFQSQPAQEDCKSRIENLSQEKENLKSRNETDKENLLAQAQFYGEVEKLKSAWIKTSDPTHKKLFNEFSTPNEMK